MDGSLCQTGRHWLCSRPLQRWSPQGCRYSTPQQTTAQHSTAASAVGVKIPLDQRWSPQGCRYSTANHRKRHGTSVKCTSGDRAPLKQNDMTLSLLNKQHFHLRPSAWPQRTGSQSAGAGGRQTGLALLHVQLDNDKSSTRRGCMGSSPMRVWSRCWAPPVIRCVRRPSLVRLSLRPPAVGVTRLSCAWPAGEGFAALVSLRNTKGSNPKPRRAQQGRITCCTQSRMGCMAVSTLQNSSCQPRRSCTGLCCLHPL